MPPSRVPSACTSRSNTRASRAHPQPQPPVSRLQISPGESNLQLGPPALLQVGFPLAAQDSSRAPVSDPDLLLPMHRLSCKTVPRRRPPGAARTPHRVSSRRKRRCISGTRSRGLKMQLELGNGLQGLPEARYTGSLVLRELQRASWEVAVHGALRMPSICRALVQKPCPLSSVPS